MSKWLFNPQEGDQAISLEGSDDVVMYINDVHPEVITDVVERVNDDYSIKKIKDYLESDERVTPDEVEFIMEAVEDWYKNPPNDVKTVVAKEEVIEVEEDSRPMTQQESDKALSHSGGQLPVAEVKTRKQKTVKSVSAPGKKKLSIEEQVAYLQEKIELLKIFNELENQESVRFPENLSKPGRDIMISFTKEYDALIAKYVEEIQSM